MTVAEARKLLATLPDDAVLCYWSEYDMGHLMELTSAQMIRVGGIQKYPNEPMRCIQDSKGAVSVALISAFPYEEE